MTTKRLQIRDALVALVATATGHTVHTNLDYAIDDKALPNSAVMSGDDEVDDAAGTTLSLAYVGMSARFGIHHLVLDGTDPEAAADPFELAVKDAIAADSTLGGLATDIRYLGGEWQFDLGNCAIRRLVFQATFITP